MGYPLSYVYLACFVLMTVLATLVAAAGPAQPSRRWIVLILTLVGVWALADFFSNIAATSAQMRWVSLMTAPIWAVVPYAVLHTAATYTGVPARTWSRWAGPLLLPALGVIALDWTENLHAQYDVAAMRGGYFVSHATGWQHVVNGYFLLYFIGAALVVLRTGKQSVPATERRRVAGFLWRWAAPAAAVGGLTNGGLVLLGHEPPYLGTVFATVVCSVAAVGVLRRTFMAPMEEVQNLKAQVAHAQKLESLGVLAGGIAHDFNNLLVGVLGNASLVLGDLPETSPSRERVERIVLAARRAAALTGAMLAYSGQAKSVVEAVSFTRLVTEMARLLEVSLAKGTHLELALAQSLPLVLADPAQLQQVVMNLITNASEAIGERGGAIRVETGRARLAPRSIVDAGSGEAVPTGDYVFLRVADDGIGMDRKTRERIFDPFFTTKFTGRGLGLAVVLGILRTHRGAITVDSRPGHGTTFTIYLPQSDIAPEVASTDLPLAAALPGGRGTVLVVDDEATVREVATIVLSRAGFQVLSAADGDEAVKVVREHPAGLRAVLLDLTMPRLDGRRALAEIRALDPVLPVVLTTGFDAEQVTHGFPTDQHVGFLQKPFSPDDLVRAIMVRLTPTS